MKNDPQDFEVLDAPEIGGAGDIFVSPLAATPKKPAKPAPAPPPPDKGPGAGDSVRQRSAVKAPGGHDAARARDGG